MNLSKIDPNIVIINDKVINMELLDQYPYDYNNNTIKLVWLDGSVEGLKFDNKIQLREAVGRLDRAMHYMLYGN